MIIKRKSTQLMESLLQAYKIAKEEPRNIIEYDLITKILEDSNIDITSYNPLLVCSKCGDLLLSTGDYIDVHYDDILGEYCQFCANPIV